MWRDPTFRRPLVVFALLSGVCWVVVWGWIGWFVEAEPARPSRATAAALHTAAWASLAVWATSVALFAAFSAAAWLRAASVRLAMNEPKAVFPRGMPGVVGDIARRAEALLDEARALRRDRSAARGEAEAILSAMTEAVVSVDGEGRIRVANAASARLLGLDPAKSVGEPIGGVVRTEGVADLARRAVGGEELRRQVQVPGPPARVLDVHAEPVRPSGGALLVLNDATEEAAFADMRRDFVAAASHELRTPLAIIRGCVETLLDGGLDDPPKAREFLQDIERNVRGMSALIGDLLDLGKLESKPEFVPRPCGIADVVHAAVAQHAAEAKRKGQALEVGVEEPLPHLMADAGLLERAVANILENAIRYTPAGGRVAVRARAEGASVRVEVEDTGPGIPDKDLKRIFERFYRVDRSRSRELGGTGLGLAIVKHIVALHKGEVWAESGPGRGAKFVLRLPGFGA
jgi:two-component system phosphate regulon sensor histidine kinase PhoR